MATAAKKSKGCSMGGLADAGSLSALYALLAFLFFVAVARRRVIR
jgi:hypothetical protein